MGAVIWISNVEHVAAVVIKHSLQNNADLAMVPVLTYLKKNYASNAMAVGCAMETSVINAKEQAYLNQLTLLRAGNVKVQEFSPPKERSNVISAMALVHTTQNVVSAEGVASINTDRLFHLSEACLVFVNVKTKFKKVSNKAN